ncbi:polysaccharide pyruvyl transferase family protein [Pontibacter sp. BAB1700]|uniref:polysaccharide pyruvyl transferase family protein n=1 Tax=Pontibacter sp. BAB1700 TaxID=1144253 RepID=UPI00026BD678|nr:polysaccharide pyruvyl transferase family protein [Pontibacter sp. BAB1700]EJF08470.1 polysaccharide pyruvyl transferase [Pontibacter sp. BAB1700]
MKYNFIITKLKTTNVGNQALTQELIDMFIEQNPYENFIFEGRPMGLDGYTIDRLENNQEPIHLFEKWARNIANSTVRDLSAFTLNQEKPTVSLVNFSAEDAALESLKAKYLRPVKRYLSRYIVYNSVYKNRLAKIKGAKTLIYSGAGEVGDNNVFLRQLLEIRVAQLLGLKTAIVNQSVVLKTKLFHQLTGHVYGKLDQLVVRGQISKNNLISYGVDGSKIKLAPDTAFKTKEPKADRAKVLANTFNINEKTVGINITNWFKTDFVKLEKAINLIKAKGFRLIFITNEPFEDRNLGKIFEEKFDIPFITEKLHYQDYAALLSNLDMLISARLHTNVLALTAKTKVIPIEGNVFKTTELLQLAQYPITVIDSTIEGWEDKLFLELSKVFDEEYDFKSYFENVFPKIQGNVLTNSNWLNVQ